ncbi:MAG: hypothetical protein H0U10_06665 [Chloroflexia bacterium]|nr:hypothetical protein [Chloroflexia bacterium]
MMIDRTRSLVRWLVPGIAGVGAALADVAAAAKKKDDGRTAQRDERQTTDGRSGQDDGDDRDRRDRADDADGGDNDNGRVGLRQRASDGDSGDADATARRGEVDIDQQSTPIPTTTTFTTTTITDEASPRESRASIEDADGNVIVGFDRDTQTLVARSGNVTASVGPDGPKVIIDDEAVVPVDDDGREPRPDPDGGDNDMDMVS